MAVIWLRLANSRMAWNHTLFGNPDAKSAKFIKSKNHAHNPIRLPERDPALLKRILLATGDSPGVIRHGNSDIPRSLAQGLPCYGVSVDGAGRALDATRPRISVEHHHKREMHPQFTRESTMRTVVGMFETREAAEDAINRLLAAGFTREAIGVAMRDPREASEIAESTGTEDLSAEGATAGAVSGAGVGALVGLALVGSTVLVPGVGPVLIGGPLAAALTGAGVWRGVWWPCWRPGRRGHSGGRSLHIRQPGRTWSYPRFRSGRRGECSACSPDSGRGRGAFRLSNEDLSRIEKCQTTVRGVFQHPCTVVYFFSRLSLKRSQHRSHVASGDTDHRTAWTT